MRKVHGTSCKKRQCALVLRALLWLATGTQQSQRSSVVWGWAITSGFSAHRDQRRIRWRVSWNKRAETAASGAATKGSGSMTLLWTAWTHSCRGEVWKLRKGRKEGGTCAHLLLWGICRVIHKGPSPRGQCLKDCHQQYKCFTCIMQL